MGLEVRHGLVLLTILPTLHIASLVVFFKVFQHSFWGLSRGETVAAMFTASHKTLAFGLPLVNTIFEGNVNLAAYCAPIMFIHPLQLVLGSFFVPRLLEYTKGGEQTRKDEWLKGRRRPLPASWGYDRIWRGSWWWKVYFGSCNKWMSVVNLCKNCDSMIVLAGNTVALKELSLWIDNSLSVVLWSRLYWNAHQVETLVTPFLGLATTSFWHGKIVLHVVIG